MKTILIVTALSQEGKVVKQELKKYNKKDIKLLYLSTGIGNYKMILELTKFLQKHRHIDFLVNIGVCGKTGDSSDFLNIARVINLHTKRELIVPQLLDYPQLDSIICSENIVTNPDVLGEEDFVDMESYGFELVADSFRLPRVILKVPVDEIGEETKNFEKKQALQKLSENIHYEELLEKIETYLEKNQKSTPDFEIYFSNWKLTFSEKEQLKKLFFKYETLTKENFERYFLEHREEEKIVFLQTLEQYLQTFIIK